MDQLIETLRAIVGSDSVLTNREELLVYECDGLPQHKYLPRAVVFPESTEAVAEVMGALVRFGVPFTPRGAGTGLSGGALALNSGVVVELARMRKILKLDYENRIAIVETGVVNLHVSKATAHLGLYYVPDPSSQPTCTIGGNIAENAGGIHCLKYGTTTDHVLGARVVLSNGAILDLVSGETGRPGYDLLGVFTGSEGTFGLATEATLRLTTIPPAIRTLLAEFEEVSDASHAVSAIIAGGLMPAALEMMDREIIRAIEASIFAAGLPADIGAALLVELDGLEPGIDDEAEQVKAICIKHGARSCRLARDDNERKKLWAARKGAFGAIGRITPDSMIQDAVVPRSRLPEVMQQSYLIAAKYQLLLANVFHAGDGNLHPFICFDSRSPEEVLRVKEAGRELMEVCVRAGGSITGEHGVGFDKREYLSLIFSEDDMRAMLQVRAAFDPTGLCNPGKIIPMLRGCGEARAVQSQLSSEILSAEPNTGTSVEPLTTQMTDVLPRKPLGSFEPASALKLLNEAIGEERVTFTANGNGRDLLTVLPGSTEETIEVMKLASQSGWRVLPAGSGTALKGRLKEADLLLSTRHLDRIIEHEPADLIARAEAGVTLANFNEELSRNGQWLPLDPPDDPEAERITLGGVVATGLAGAQQLGYGPPRRSVIGMRVVLADGTAIKVGGRVVKNVAGYDLCKLFTGSHGTLGVITELTFKLRPLPAACATLIVAGDRDLLLTAARSIRSSSMFLPVAIELLSGLVAANLNLLPGTHEALLLMRFAGSPGAVEDQITRAHEIAVTQSEFITTEAERDADIWRLVAALPLQHGGEQWRAGVAPAQIQNFLSHLSDRTSWQAGLGTGIIRAYVQPDERAGYFGELRNHAEELGGWFITDREIEEPAPSQNGPRHSPAEALMNRLKAALDPTGILPRCRFGSY